jgi:Phosphopantetheine attachment site
VQGPEEKDGVIAAAPGSAAAPQIELLRRLWAEALEVASVELDDDFFALGGDSLAVARIVITAAAEGVTLNPNLFVEHRTIRQMAGFL